MSETNIHKNWREDLLDILENGVKNGAELNHTELEKTWPKVKYLIDTSSRVSQ